jgi:hypothetical protein
LCTHDLLFTIVCNNKLAEKLATDSRVSYLSFIGSAQVGWYLRSKLSPGTHCALEHGGAAPVIVEPDEDNALDLDGNGQADVYLPAPDFKFVYFQSNLVIRWEYLPGSTVFLVWSQAREDGIFDKDQLSLEIPADMDQMFAIFPHDVLMLLT